MQDISIGVLLNYAPREGGRDNGSLLWKNFGLR